MCILPYLHACYYQKELDWETKLSWMDCSHSPELPLKEEIKQEHCLQPLLRSL